MFVYCLNNAVNYYDCSGTDAIWIQEGKSAGWQGHSGLLVQDSDGNWFYFYWGPADKMSDLGSGKIIWGTDTKFVLEYVETNGEDLRTTEGLMNALSSDANKETFAAKQSGNITGSYYLAGDYHKTYLYLEDLANQYTNSDYHLIYNNCVQQTYTALAASDYRFKSYYPLHPNYTFWRITVLLDLAKTLDALFD